MSKDYTATHVRSGTVIGATNNTVLERIWSKSHEFLVKSVEVMVITASTGTGTTQLQLKTSGGTTLVTIPIGTEAANVKLQSYVAAASQDIAADDYVTLEVDKTDVMASYAYQVAYTSTFE